MKLSGRVCLITGASRGLGAALARAFWGEGASLCLCARDSEALAKLQAEFRDSKLVGQECLTIIGDLAEPSRPILVIDESCSRLGRVDILINNAAVQGPIGRLWENPLDEWERCLRTNLLVPAAMCAAVIPHMKERGRGKIINLSGGGATSPRANFSAYAASKTALVRLTETLAHETRGMGIDVNCVAPGVMPTRLLAEVVAAGPEKAGAKEYAQAQTCPQGDDDVLVRAAELCLFLASSASDGVTGRLISARWDAWDQLPGHLEALSDSDVYTLRRIVPADRGMNWGEVR